MELQERLSRETGRDYALRIIKDNIIKLVLAPGSMVSENELAAEMGLSRTPVREALIELSKVKIVEIYPQKGSVVSLIDYTLVEEARFMRNVLECAVVEEACQFATPAHLASLEENVKLQEFYLKNFVPGKLMELDNDFHKQLFSVTNKVQIYALMNSITVHFDRVRGMSLTAVKDLKIVADHRNIVEAMKQRDAQQTKQVMEKHLSRYKIDADAIRQTYPNYFK